MPSLERLFTGWLRDESKQATVLQRAICRIADGQAVLDLATEPLLANADAYPPEVRERATWEWAVGDVHALPVGERPVELYPLGGIRTGKSLFCAALGVRAGQAVKVDHLGPGEVPRVSIVSLKLDTAKVVLGHLHGRVHASPRLRAQVLEQVSDAVTLRHPSGRPVEVKVVAGARAGGSLVARWSAGAIFDEAPRMLGQEDGVVNLDDALTAVRGRLLPNAQVVGAGSPWAPLGPVYDTVQEHWQKPSAQVVVVRGVAPALNPFWWTPERVEALCRSDEQAYRTDVLGEFADVEMALFLAGDLERARRNGPLELPPEPGAMYTVAIDPATRNNAWTLTMVHLGADGRLRQVLAREWRGTVAEPLSPDRVFAEIAELLRPYWVATLWSDQYAADALRDIAARHGLYLATHTVTSSWKVQAFEKLRTLLADKRLELSPLVLDDLRRVGRRVTQHGVSIELPRTADGRHCDHAAALALATDRAVPDAAPEAPKVDHDADPVQRLAEHKQHLAELFGIGEGRDDTAFTEGEWLIDD